MHELVLIWYNSGQHDRKEAFMLDETTGLLTETQPSNNMTTAMANEMDSDMKNKESQEGSEW